jgi:hypothetical protein
MAVTRDEYGLKVLDILSAQIDALPEGDAKKAIGMNIQQWIRERHCRLNRAAFQFLLNKPTSELLGYLIKKSGYSERLLIGGSPFRLREEIFKDVDENPQVYKIGRKAVII